MWAERDQGGECHKSVQALGLPPAALHQPSAWHTAANARITMPVLFLLSFYYNRVGVSGESNLPPLVGGRGVLQTCEHARFQRGDLSTSKTHQPFVPFFVAIGFLVLGTPSLPESVMDSNTIYLQSK